LGELGLDGRTILKASLVKERLRMWTGLAGSRQGSVAVCFEYGNEISGSIKGREFLD
jgi:hypothetical protein